MFSGIIESTAKILQITDGRFTVENVFEEPLQVGQSIAHDGACMTIESWNQESYTFFAMAESMRRTNFGAKQVGDRCNVERCVKVGDRIDGHFVTGHIDTTGTLENIENIADGSKIYTIRFPGEYTKYLVSKGSISINGVSLTVMSPSLGSLQVSLIPLTQEMTNL
ncbi:MAG: riboflavin synthase [Candidatus Peribacteria bacterium]|nr:MAG: riboflavin synthase [Candidatus Peribacteria bacterium]